MQLDELHPLFLLFLKFKIFCHDVVDGDIEQTHVMKELGEGVVHEGLAALFRDALPGSLGHEISHAALLEDDVVAAQLLVGLHCRIGIDLKEGSVVANAGDAGVLLKPAREYLGADTVVNLKVDGLFL